MRHVVLLLPKPDWIQLSNVHRKMENHPTAEIYTISTLKGKLSSPPAVHKIHCVGHGSPTSAQHISTPDLAKAIKESGLPDGETEIRLDTCSSAFDFGKSGMQNFAQQLLATLKAKPYEYKKLKTSGTTGSSVTGFIAGREVVLPNRLSQDMAGQAQNVISVLYYEELNRAKLLAAGFSESMSHSEIKSLAAQVSAATEGFFLFFKKYLKNYEACSGQQILADKDTDKYKQTY